jgi:polar amino acid transport system substrate-binding protein
LRDIKLLEPPLARVDFYLYMHKKHAPIIPEIAGAIREMKRDGTKQRIYESVRRKLGF